MKLASPLNIWSGSSEMNGLGAALTNPTELSFKKGKIKHHYPVVFNNQSFVDAEAVFQAYRTGYIEPDKQIMTSVIKAKLEQHPQLLSAITFRGGVAWLKTCSHLVGVKSSHWERCDLAASQAARGSAPREGVKSSHWEGVGRKSNFIACLIEAYTEVIPDIPF